MSLLTHLLLPMPVTRLPFPEVNRMILDALKKDDISGRITGWEIHADSVFRPGR